MTTVEARGVSFDRRRRPAGSGHRRRQPAAPLGPRRRRIRLARVRRAGDPHIAAPLARRGHDRPGRRRYRRRHPRAVWQHRRRRRCSRPRRRGAHRSRQRRLHLDADVPRHGRGARPARSGQVAVRRSGHAGCRTHARRCAVRPRLRRRRTRGPRPPHGAGGRRRHGAAAIAAARVARRALVRRADAPRLPDRARAGDRPAVGCDGRARTGGHGRRALLRRRRHRLPARRRPERAVRARQREARSRRRIPHPLPRARRARRLGCGADGRPDRHDQRAVVAPAQRRVVRTRPPGL